MIGYRVTMANLDDRVIERAARWALKVVTVPKSLLYPIVLVLCVVGAFALNNTMSSVYVLLTFGVALGVVLTGVTAGLIIAGDIGQAGRQSAPSPARLAFGADDPAAQLDRLLTR